MTEGQLRELIRQEKTACLPNQTPIEVLLWTLATELEKRLPPEAPTPIDGGAA